MVQKPTHLVLILYIGKDDVENIDHTLKFSIKLQPTETKHNPIQIQIGIKPNVFVAFGDDQPTNPWSACVQKSSVPMTSERIKMLDI
jgi:hypothetical protein